MIDYLGTRSQPSIAGAARLTVSGEDRHLVHEAGSYFILSRAGEHLDSCGLPRLHGLALSGRGGALVLVSPLGRQQEHPGVPGRSGTDALPAAGRGQPAGGPPRAPSSLSASCRAERGATPRGVAAGAPCGRSSAWSSTPRCCWTLRRSPTASSPPPSRSATSCWAPRSVGTGRRRSSPYGERPAVPPAAPGGGGRASVVYQGMEFVLQRGPVDVLTQARPALVRAACCAALVRRARVWRLTPRAGSRP